MYDNVAAQPADTNEYIKSRGSLQPGYIRIVQCCSGNGYPLLAYIPTRKERTRPNASRQVCNRRHHRRLPCRNVPQRPRTSTGDPSGRPGSR
ncbi:hypothetical protein CBM2586_A11692 [Cupriavidus phytorum]|uniref:Uncharacterized protein n=1 Tax=Cupriavidus taiwanensis TaxID=164546 RepID=A0A975WSY1_9BURK|nr:hypothetical protein CBM2586_A11692 [Cupriavidus taiwanensis]